jgi:hypothetical protein
MRLCRQNRRASYFNNDWEGFAVNNGLWLRRRLEV